MPGRPTIRTTVRQGPIALAVGAGGGCLDIFTLLCPFFSFSLSLGWLVGCFGFTTFETAFQSISGRLPKRGRKRRERIDESKNVQTTSTRTYYNCSKPSSYCNPNCRMVPSFILKPDLPSCNQRGKQSC